MFWRKKLIPTFANKFSKMPYFRITVLYDDGSTYKCIRQHLSYDIEFVNRYFAEQMKKSTRGRKVEKLEAVMVSKQSKEVKAFINAQVRRGPLPS